MQIFLNFWVFSYFGDKNAKMGKGKVGQGELCSGIQDLDDFIDSLGYTLACT